MDEARKEQIKLTANFLNTIAAGLFVAGAITPVVALLFGFVNAQLTFLGGVAVVFVCLAGSVGLHLLARLQLRRIKE